MTRRVRWTMKALGDLDETIAYIAARDEMSAVAVKNRVREAAERLARHPTGRPSRVAGYFEKPVAKTRLTLCYRLSDERLIVVRCIHQSRNWPSEDWPETGETKPR